MINRMLFLFFYDAKKRGMVACGVVEKKGVVHNRSEIF